MDVAMELSRILITELGEQQVIFLREKNAQQDNPRSFPIIIGPYEAWAINRRLKGICPPRPMTHDLLANTIEKLGGVIEKIVINDLRDLPQPTFIATLHIRCGDNVVEIDSRPSDAIALGVGLDTPIFVAEEVLDNVTNNNSTMMDRIELLKDRLDILVQEISHLSGKLADESLMNTTPPETSQQMQGRLDEMQSEYEAIVNLLKKLKQA